MERKQIKIIVVSVSLLVLLVVFLALNPFVKIGAGQRGVVLNWGAVSDTVLDEGLHFRIPIMQKIVKIDVRIQKDEVASGAASKDLQIVSSTIALNYHLDPKHVNKVWQEIGKDFNERIIAPSIQEAVKATTAKFTAEELITKREEVKEQIKANLSKRLFERNIIVDEFNIISFSFSSAFDDAIEAKVTAEQLKLKADRDLERIEIEAQQKIADAVGKAEAIRIEAIALKQNPQVVELRWIEKWNGEVPTYWGQATPFIGINR